MGISPSNHQLWDAIERAKKAKPEVFAAFEQAIRDDMRDMVARVNGRLSPDHIIQPVLSVGMNGMFWMSVWYSWEVTGEMPMHYRRHKKLRTFRRIEVVRMSMRQELDRTDFRKLGIQAALKIVMREVKQRKWVSPFTAKDATEAGG